MGQYCAKCFICSNLFNPHNIYVLMHTYMISTYVLTHKYYYSYLNFTVDSLRPREMEQIFYGCPAVSTAAWIGSQAWTPEVRLGL